MGLDDAELDDQTIMLCPIASILSDVSSVKADGSPLEFCSSSEDPSDWSSARPRKLTYTHAAGATATAAVPHKVKGRIPSSKANGPLEGTDGDGGKDPAGVVVEGQGGKGTAAAAMAMLRQRFAKAQAPQA
jgi:hypothetical protein